jgi:GGDEF domain-containing protein
VISAPLLGKGDEAFALGRWWQQFLDAEVEDAFQRYALPLHAVALQRMLIVGGLGWLGFSANDWLMGGTAMLATSLPLRLASAAACFGMSWWLRRDDLDARTIGRIATAASVVCLGGIAWMLYLAPATGLPLAMLAAMVTIAVYLLIPNRLSRALLIAMAANVAFLAVAARLGTFTPVALAAVAVVQAGVNVFGFIVAQDIQRTWRREFQAYVGQQRVAVHDHLTGCLNRRYLSEQLLPAEIERASRYKTWLSVIVCDADHFKAVNDRHGHPTGDAVLRALAAQLLAGTRRGVDGVVRFGGEEFLLLLPSTARPCR